MQTKSSPTYLVSSTLLAREDFRAACAALDFGKMFRLMRQYDGVSQTRISDPIEGLNQSRLSKIMNGKEGIVSFEVIKRIAQTLHIPGSYFGLAPLQWEIDAGLVVEHGDGPSIVREPAGEVIDRCLSLDIDVAPDGSVTLNYRQELVNNSSQPSLGSPGNCGSSTPASPGDRGRAPGRGRRDARNLIIKKIHQTTLNATYGCQIYPAVQPGQSATVAYTCTGGRFVDEFYWRQAVVVPTAELRMRLTHRGIRQLTDCSGLEERPDGSELSVADSIAWTRTDDAVVVELTRQNLEINQALTLRWDFARATA